MRLYACAMSHINQSHHLSMTHVIHNSCCVPLCQIFMCVYIYVYGCRYIHAPCHTSISPSHINISSPTQQLLCTTEPNLYVCTCIRMRVYQSAMSHINTSHHISMTHVTSYINECVPLCQICTCVHRY